MAKGKKRMSTKEVLEAVKEYRSMMGGYYFYGKKARPLNEYYEPRRNKLTEAVEELERRVAEEGK